MVQRSTNGNVYDCRTLKSGEEITLQGNTELANMGFDVDCFNGMEHRDAAQMQAMKHKFY